MYEKCLGRTIIFIGCSTTRDLANHMLQKMENISLLEPTPHVLDKTFKTWNITNLRCDETKGYGCNDCFCASSSRKCRYDWVDYEAFHHQSNTRVIFSWKPDLYRDSDAVAIYTRFIKLKHAIVFLGKGLHDATSQSAYNQLMFFNIHHLFKISLTFDKTTRVIMRTPLKSMNKKEEHILQQIRTEQLKTWNNSRVEIIDGYSLTSNTTPYDNHHYAHNVHETLLQHIC